MADSPDNSSFELADVSSAEEAAQIAEPPAESTASLARRAGTAAAAASAVYAAVLALTRSHDTAEDVTLLAVVGRAPLARRWSGPGSHSARVP